MASEQPLLADLFEMPAAADIGLRCTNLRMLDGKRPIFVDDSGSVFVFPYHRISFVEIPARSAVGTDVGDALPMPVAAAVPVATPAVEVEHEEDIEIDEDFLRRIREV